jgi:hypothetical protein
VAVLTPLDFVTATVCASDDRFERARPRILSLFKVILQLYDFNEQNNLSAGLAALSDYFLLLGITVIFSTVGTPVAHRCSSHWWRG